MTPLRGSLDAEAASLLEAAQRDGMAHCPRCGAESSWTARDDLPRLCVVCQDNDRYDYFDYVADYYRALREDR